MYARRKKIPLDHISVDVLHDKRHVEALESTSPQKVDVFRREIRLYGTLTDEQRASLMAIADKCPVHRTLHASSHIETLEVPAAD